MLRKMVCVSSKIGVSGEKIRKLKIEVKKRAIKTGTYAAIIPRSISKTIRALVSIKQELLMLKRLNPSALTE